MKLARLLSPFCAGAAVVLLLAGCSKQEESFGGAAAPVASAANQTYYFIGVSISAPYWDDARIGLEERGKQLGVKTVFTGVPSSDVQKQAQMLDDIVAQRPDGVIMAPADAGALKAGIDRAVEAGVAVVTVDTDSPESKRYCYAGTANYEAGLVVGKLLAEAIGGKGKVGISTLAGQWNLEERKRGVLDAIKKFPDIQVVQTVDDRADPQMGIAQNRAMMSANPDMVGIAGLNAISGPAIAQAVVEANKKGQIKIVCFDRDEGMLNFIEDGTILASVAQKTHLMAATALQMLFDLRNGRIKHLPDWRAAGPSGVPMPASIDTGIMIINKGNVAQFRHKK